MSRDLGDDHRKNGTHFQKLSEIFRGSNLCKKCSFWTTGWPTGEISSVRDGCNTTPIKGTIRPPVPLFGSYWGFEIRIMVYPGDAYF